MTAVVVEYVSSGVGETTLQQVKTVSMAHL